MKVVTASVRFAVIAAISCMIVAGCTTGARQGAAQGGAMGLIGGAAAGAVNSLLFGGNVLEGAVQGGVVGAAGGAAAGAVQGGISEKQQAKPSAKSDKQVKAFRKELGDLNFQAMVYLVQCKHRDAIKFANQALDETDQVKRKVFALTVRAVSELETGKDEAAEATYAEIAALDKNRPVDRARADTLQAMLKVQSVRKENDLPSCGR
jgi:hypothetical protein